jgi:hypothetical protein
LKDEMYDTDATHTVSSIARSYGGVKP